MNNPRDVGTVGLRVFWGWWTVDLGGGGKMTLDVPSYVDLISMLRHLSLDMLEVIV